MSTSSLHKIVVVVGTTGVGKTKLGVDLAQHFSGEVINADVMQMYKGLEVATAKVTEEERQGIPHHLMSFLEPHETFSPHEFRKLADKKIREISERGKLPILVGGTMYYVQGLLWDHLIDHGGAGSLEVSTTVEGSSSSSSSSSSVTTTTTTSNESNSLWDELNNVDPEMAAELHPNNVRKIARSLDVYRKSGGKTHTELLRLQRERGGGISSLSNSRYPNACILWCRCDRDVLKDRLDNRVLTMISNGLREEIVALQASEMKRIESLPAQSLTTASSMPYDTSRGVFQSIGFKEFDEYLSLVRTKGEKNNEKGDFQDDCSDALQRGVEKLQMSTKRYARKQLTWIRNRWIGNNIPVHVLDTTIVEKWNENVNNVAQSIVRSSLGVTGCVGSIELENDRKIKRESLNESKRIQIEHEREQQKNKDLLSKKRKYHERKREKNRQRKEEWLKKKRMDEEEVKAEI